MESKSKTFARNLLALFLAVVLAISCFTGAITAFAKSTDDYHDDNLASNFLAWAETTDEQTAEALLDYADLYVGDLMTSLMGSEHLYFSQSVVVTTISIDAYMDSVDGLLDLIRQVQGLLDSYGSLIGGDIKNLDLTPLSGLSYVTSGDSVLSKCGKSYRSVNDAKTILMALAETLYINSNNFAGKNVLKNFFVGTLDLGTILEKVLGGTVYDLLQDSLNMWDGYETNLAYNIVANLIWENTNWYTDEEIASFKADFVANGANQTSWDFDTELFSKLTTNLVDKINVLVTYPNTIEIEQEKTDDNGDVIYGEDGVAETETVTVKDSSKYRKQKIDAYMEENNASYETAAKALGYDPNLKYSEEEGYTNNILLFEYGDEKLEVTKTDTLFNIAFKALKIAWETVLEPTLSLVNVNYDVDRGNGANFDNVFYQWIDENVGWNKDDWKSNYSEANVKAWAEAVYEKYEAADADEFLANVKHTFEYDRSAKTGDDAEGNWQDIDSTTLFNKLRYNPLADLYFNMQTGPINLYFLQTGIDSISDFFDTAFTTYDNMVAGFNDALVAVTEVVFPESSNIGYGTDDDYQVVTNLTVPEMKKTGNLSFSSSNKTASINTVTSTLVSNALKMVEYVANTTDANILASFYTNNSITTLAGNLSEANLEEAMVPMLIACLQNVTMTEPIHDEKWDACVDAEGVAVVALEEYLSFVLPDKDYSVLWSYDSNGKLVAGNIDISGDGNYTLFDDTLLPMVRDALGYILSSQVPCRTKDGATWDVYTTDVKTDKTTIFEILNSVLCYYGSADTFSNDKTEGKAVGSLLGCVDSSDGSCQISTSNTLWENIDIVVNKLMPVIGTLQYGDSSYKGKASSYDLIYNKIIKGFLDIGTNSGITNFIKQFFTICTSDPIANEGIDLMVYDDIVAPLVNGLFGARYDGQGYTYVMPYSEYYDRDTSSNTKSESPFNALIHVDTLGYYNSEVSSATDDKTGIIGDLICNIYEMLGGSTYGTSHAKGAAGAWQGLMYAVVAVNNFIPSFVPELSDHTIGTATAEVADPAMSGVTAGSNITATTLDITNGSIGLNRFYRDANGNVQQDDRGFVSVKNITITDDKGNSVNNINIDKTTGIIAPEKTLRVNVTGTAPSTDTLYTFTITYDIYEGKMSGSTYPTQTSDNTLYTNLTTTAYLNISNQLSWQDTLYPSSRIENGIYRFAEKYETDTPSTSAVKTTAYTTSTLLGGSNNKLWGILPNDFVVSMSNPSSINDLGIRVKNTTNSTVGTDYAYDGVYNYITSGTKYYAVSGTTEADIASTYTTASADDTTMAYVAIDKTTGDLLNYDLYDYSLDGGTTWNRGETASDSTTYDKNTFVTKGMKEGFTSSEIQAMLDDETNTDVQNAQNAGKWATRTHVEWTFEEALAAGVVKGVDRSVASVKDGVTTYTYSAVFIAPTTLYLMGSYNSGEQVKHSLSWGTPTPGIYLAAGKTKVTKGNSAYTKFLKYDGTTELEADEYDMKVSIFTNNNNRMGGTIHMVIADDTQSTTLLNAYNSDLTTIAPYRASDFTDYDSETGTSEAYEGLVTALGSALATVSTPLNATTGPALGSTKIKTATTKSTTSITGDKAYKPLLASENLPAAIAAYATKGTGADGNQYWYYNEECTMPVYYRTSATSDDALTDNDVINQVKENGVVVEGTDKTGQAVIKVDGVWYLKNANKYEQAWDTTTYVSSVTGKAIPYQYDNTEKQATQGDSLLYSQIQFVYRDADGKKVRSDENWLYKFAEGTSVTKPNDSATATEYRGLYEQNIDNLAYYLEQVLAKVDKTFASRVATKVTEDRDGMNNVNHDVVSYEKMVKVAKEAENLIWYEDGTPVTNKSSLQIDEAVRIYQRYKARVIDRNYIGDKLEAEIACASNYTYNQLTATATYAEDGETVDSYSVTGTANQDAEYGAYNDEGVLVNEGDIVYTDASWTAYVNALGAAVSTATLGNTDKTASSARVSNVYTVKTNLQKAENNLTEKVDSGNITISGQIVIASDTKGDNGSVGIVGIVALVDGVEVEGSASADDGTFSFEVPAGTTEITFHHENATIDRTVTLTGDADVTDVVIPIVVCDYTGDGYITSADRGLFFSSVNKPANFNVYMDLSGDGYVTSADRGLFFNFMNKTISYTEMALD